MTPRYRVVVATWLMLAGLAALAPLLSSSAAWTAFLSKVLILSLYALSYNTLLGGTGLLSFGHAIYLGVPAYACLHLTTAIGKREAALPLELVPAFGALVGAAMGLTIGRVTTRQAGTAFAMITLGIGELVHAAAYVFPSFFGGEAGISTDRMVDRTLTPFSFGPAIQVYYLVLAWVAGSAALLWLAGRTPLGRAAAAVRENPERIRFLGYDPRTVRWLQTAIAGAAAGVAGGLFAITYEIATAEVLGLRSSANVLVAAYLGGTGHFLGPVLGAVLVTAFETVVGRSTEAWLLYYGALFVAVVIFAPRGLAGLAETALQAARRERLGPTLSAAARPLPGILALGTGIVVAVETAFFLSNTFDPTARASLFGIGYDPRASAPWLLSAALLAAGAGWLVVQRRAATRRGALR